MAMNKSNLIKAFNTHFFEFIDDIIRIYPENTDMRTAKIGFETFKRANPSIMIKIWFSKVYLPYKETIDQGDVTFFFDKNYSDDLTGLSNGKEIMAVIDKIRAPIRAMDAANQAHAAKYLQNLSKLSNLHNASTA